LTIVKARVARRRPKAQISRSPMASIVGSNTTAPSGSMAATASKTAV
jgi:hypothetical protein